MAWKKRVDTSDDKRFRRLVRIRDKNTCQLCGTKKGKKDVHHITRYSSSIILRTSVDNGILLCRSCHKLTFRREEFYAPLFREIIEDKKK